jgi:cytochrome bd ubiquinol oxidase subunit II
VDAYTALQVVWFVLLAILWVGYFVLEGFDFGVGMLLRVIGRTSAERRAVIHTIGPVWDGNEVWLIVAGGATFAAFPQWYATLFSGFYLALFLILVALIVRGVSFEFWGKRDEPAWRNGWEWCITLGSAVAAFLWGVAWANIIHGVPIDGRQEYVGNIWDLLHPYALLGGVVTLALFVSHGAMFLTLRTTGELEERARAAAGRAAPVAALVTVGFLVWTVINEANRTHVEWLFVALAAIAALLLLGAPALVAAGRAGRAFALSALAIVALFAALFVDLFPHTMVSSISPRFDMTLDASSSSHYTLVVMSVVAAILVPLVLLYQGWSYWVFRKRVSAEDFSPASNPIDAVRGRTAPDR